MKILINRIKKKDGTITHLSWKKEGDENFKISKKSDLISEINCYKKTQNVEIETYVESGSPKSISIINDKYLRTGADKNTNNDLLDLPICEISIYESIIQLLNNIIEFLKNLFK